MTTRKQFYSENLCNWRVETFRMKAIVLTYDKQIGCAELVQKRYSRLWQSCPLDFLIPANDISSPIFDYLRTQDNVHLVQTEPDIRSTMYSLLEPIPDNEWVYWCCDDRFPIKIEQEDINSISNEMHTQKFDSVNAIRLIYWGEQRDSQKEMFSIGQRNFFYQLPRALMGFWHHQFIRAKVLKYIFLSSNLPEYYYTKDIKYQFYYKSYLPCLENTLIVQDKAIIQLAEPLIERRLTLNGLKALKAEKCQMPDFNVSRCNVSFKDYEKQVKRNVGFPKKSYLPAYPGFQTAKLLKELIARYRNRNPFSQASRTKILVCSFGGVGSKCLVKGILQTDNETLLQKAHIHRRTPPSKNEIKGRKVIYVFGNPMNAVISFFQRRDALSQLHGFVTKKDNTGDINWAIKHCVALEGMSDLLEPAYDLPAYLTHNIDMFKLEEHFYNWYHAKTSYPILFVRYETMWENLEEIFDFLKLSKKKIINFPKKETRASDWKDEAPEIVDGLESIYGNLRQKFDNLPDIQIRGNYRQT